jgi:hypothetical protein
MKSFLSILVFVIYVPFSTGILIDYRYCNGTTDDIGLFKAGNCCPHDLVENNCCQHVIRLAKINANYDSHVSSFSIPPLSGGLNQDFGLRSPLLETGLTESIIDHRFNFIDKNPIYLVNRVFII